MSDTDKIQPKILKLKKGNEYKIRIEEATEFKESFFKDTYVRASICVKEIIENTRMYHGTNEHSKDKQWDKKDKEEYNNIIVFSGERGTGKSSAMVSFTLALKNSKTFNKDEESSLLKEYKEIRDNNYTILDVIDPSIFERNESIFEVIIAKMFHKFKSIINEDNNEASFKKEITFEQKKKLLNLFQKVYMDLKTINSGKNDLFEAEVHSENVIDVLSRLASGTNMKRSFMELVKEYLRLFNDQLNNDKTFLVIPIDDLDMNIEHAADMVEQIRKYLIVPNIIVLMATKIEQLTDSIEQQYRQNFQIMLKKDVLTDEEDFPKNMAVRYMEKLIPIDRRLYLPQLKVGGYGQADDIILKYYKETEEDPDNLTIQAKIFKITYEKTGLIFLKPKYGIHQLVPDNIRELQNYLSMLESMDTPIDGKIPDKNIDRFENYFVNIWIKNNLPLNKVDIIHDFLNTDINYRNLFMIKTLNLMLLKKENDIHKNTHAQTVYEALRNSLIDKDSIMLKAETHRDVNDKINNPLNISIGDVLTILKVWNDYNHESKESQNFIFAIKTLYSISLRKSVSAKNTDIITKIIAGDLFGRKASKLVNKKYYEIPFRYYDKLTYKNSSFKEIVTEVVKMVGEPTKLNEVKEELLSKLHGLEWFHYFVYLGKLEDNFKEGKLYYEVPARYETSGTITNMTFNIVAFLFYINYSELNLRRLFIEILRTGNKEPNEIEEEFKAIAKYSLAKTVIEWKEKNQIPMVLPIYSIELIEAFADNIRFHVDKIIKYRSVGALHIYIDIFINAIAKTLEGICDENKHLQDKKIISSEKYDLVFIFKSCPIVGFLFKQGGNGVKISDTALSEDGELTALFKEFMHLKELNIKPSKAIKEKESSMKKTLVDWIAQFKTSGISKGTFLNRLKDLMPKLDNTLNSDLIKELSSLFDEINAVGDEETYNVKRKQWYEKTKELVEIEKARLEKLTSNDIISTDQPPTGEDRDE